MYQYTSRPIGVINPFIIYISGNSLLYTYCRGSKIHTVPSASLMNPIRLLTLWDKISGCLEASLRESSSLLFFMINMFQNSHLALTMNRVKSHSWRIVLPGSSPKLFSLQPIHRHLELSASRDCLPWWANYPGMIDHISMIWCWFLRRLLAARSTYFDLVVKIDLVWIQ